MSYTDTLEKANEISKASNILRNLLEPDKIDIPYLKFKSKWKVKSIFPYGGAHTRFLVKHNNKEVSVYLDTHSVLGYMINEDKSPRPYWEIYPLFGEDPDTIRIPMKKSKKLIKEINKLFKEQEELDIKKSFVDYNLPSLFIPDFIKPYPGQGMDAHCCPNCAELIFEVSDINNIKCYHCNTKFLTDEKN